MAELRENKDLTIVGVLECDEREFPDEDAVAVAQELIKKEILEEIRQIEADVKSEEEVTKEEEAEEEEPREQEQPEVTTPYLQPIAQVTTL